MIADIQPRLKTIIDSKTYSNVLTPNAATSFTNTSGGTNGNVILNPVYEFSYKFTQPNSSRINVYSRTGEDGQQQNAGLGTIVVRTFDTVSRTMLSDRIEVYNDPLYCVFEHTFWDRPDGVWIYTNERLRSDVNNVALGRNCLLKSTDGKVGRAFGAPIVQAAVTDYIVPLNIIPDENGQNYLYIGKGAPAGLRRAAVAIDGTLGAMSDRLISATGLTEGSIVDLGGGTLLGVFRLDGGGFLQQSSSTDYGATWAALSSTGLGAATGAKITPKLLKCMNRPGNLITMFNDRGQGNRDRGSSGNPKASALANTWVAPNFIGTPATQGNGGGVGIDINRNEYLYCVAQQTGSPVVTNLIWWILRDSYSTKIQKIAAWE